MSEIRFEQITAASRPLLENLWQLYFHDLAKYRGTRIGEDGKFGLGRLPLLFNNDDRIGYFFYLESDLVGFSIVRDGDQATRIVSEFFILGPFQRQGIGKEVALKLFRLHLGKWEISFQEINTPAAIFWRKVAEAAASTEWVEEKRQVPGRTDVPPDSWISFTIF